MGPWGATPATPCRAGRSSLAACGPADLIQRAAARVVLIKRLRFTGCNAGIARMLAAGQSWNTIQAVTGCSRATIAKIAKRMAAPPGPH